MKALLDTPTANKNEQAPATEAGVFLSPVEEAKTASPEQTCANPIDQFFTDYKELLPDNIDGRLVTIGQHFVLYGGRIVDHDPRQSAQNDELAKIVTIGISSSNEGPGWQVRHYSRDTGHTTIVERRGNGRYLHQELDHQGRPCRQHPKNDQLQAELDETTAMVDKYLAGGCRKEHHNQLLERFRDIQAQVITLQRLKDFAEVAQWLDGELDIPPEIAAFFPYTIELHTRVNGQNRVSTMELGPRDACALRQQHQVCLTMLDRYRLNASLPALPVSCLL